MTITPSMAISAAPSVLSNGKTIEDLEGENTVNKFLVDTLTFKVHDVESERDILKSKLACIEAEMKAAKDEKTGEVQELTGKVQGLKSELEEKAELIGTYTEQVSDLEGTIDKQDRKIAARHLPDSGRGSF